MNQLVSGGLKERMPEAKLPYSPEWDLSTIPEAELTSAYKRMVGAKRKTFGGGRPKSPITVAAEAIAEYITKMPLDVIGPDLLPYLARDLKPVGVLMRHEAEDALHRAVVILNTRGRIRYKKAGPVYLLWRGDAE